MIQRTSTQLYRDCLRLVAHVAGRSKKGDALRAIVRGEFRKNAKVKYIYARIVYVILIFVTVLVLVTKVA